MTCGDWDLKTALPTQCRLSGVAVPPHFSRWCNMKRSFQEHYELPRMVGMVCVVGSCSLLLTLSPCTCARRWS